jgi:hypothetical protein
VKVVQVIEGIFKNFDHGELPDLPACRGAKNSDYCACIQYIVCGPQGTGNSAFSPVERGFYGFLRLG